MELKPQKWLNIASILGLLIVPYGIETSLDAFQYAPGERLLIVPYGIETTHQVLKTPDKPLLIVPYGIETPSGRPAPSCAGNF